MSQNGKPISNKIISYSKLLLKGYFVAFNQTFFPRVPRSTHRWSLIDDLTASYNADGRTNITELPGRIRIIDGRKLRKDPWMILDVAAAGEGGLLGISSWPSVF